MSAKPTQNTMHSNIEFRNLGKIKEANIQVRPFTVIAGCNSSGKSFITKSLYSLFSGVGAANNETLVTESIRDSSQHSINLDLFVDNSLSTPSYKLSDTSTENLTESFRDNFTIPSMSHLIHFNSYYATISSSDFGLVKITEKVQADEETLAKITTLNSHPPIYLESPVYWKLSDALEAAKRVLSITAKRRNLSGNQLVSKVPKYFFDVVELLEDQVKTDEFNDIAQMIEEAIKGSLSLSDGGIQFVDKESNKAVSLSVTALGVTNLGMIALLLKRGAILPGTFLFIDEPEVHLHPMWQVVLVQVLHELSKRGVNVVIASHSIDIMKAIENIMNSDDDIDQQAHFGLNQLTEDGHSVDVTDNNFKRIAAIKEDLGKPFYDMFMGA